MEKTLKLHIEGREISVRPGTSMLEVCQSEFAQRRVIAVRVGGVLKGLRWKPQCESTVQLLTYADEEARRVYERSARYVFLMAAEDVLPGTRVRIEHSAGYGVYADLMGCTLSAALVEKIDARMREIIAADLPFERERWSRQEAMAYFEKRGQTDTVRLLNYRPYDTFDVYTCGGRSEYFYGEMLPSTGWVDAFALRLHLPGVVLQLPEPADPTRPAAFVERPKLMRALSDTARWNAILHCQNAADLNDIVSGGDVRGFMRVNEALHEKRIAEIAGRIVAGGARVVLIAGPSSSGKTTFSNRLCVQLRVCGKEPAIISLDNYYLPRDQVPKNEQGKPDLECLESLDVPLFNRQLVALLQGEEVELPIYSFEVHHRLEHGTRLRLRADQPIVIEGIHGLNPQLTRDVPSDVKYRIYVSALTQLNLDDHNRIRTTDVRLLRRMVRDHQFRGASVEYTMDMWDEVRAGEEKHIFPYQEEADEMFNSTLLYELSVLKKYAYPMLQSVSEESRWYTRAHRLLKFLNYFLTIDAEDEIPPTSILREFIGGCTFYI